MQSVGENLGPTPVRHVELVELVADQGGNLHRPPFSASDGERSGACSDLSYFLTSSLWTKTESLWFERDASRPDVPFTPFC